MILRRLTTVLIFLFLLASGPSLAGVLIIANPDVREGSMEENEIERIYLGKMTRWSDDSLIVPVMLKKGEIHEEFLDQYLDRTSHRFVSYWRQMVFTGKGIPPKSFTSEAELVAFVAATPGAVGYVSDSGAAPGIQILSIR